MVTPSNFNSLGIRRMTICHSSWIRDTKTYSLGSLGNFGEYFVSDLKFIFIEKKIYNFFEIKSII